MKRTELICIFLFVIIGSTWAQNVVQPKIMVIQDTKDLLVEYSEEDKYPLLNTISVLINQVINADGKVTTEEADSFTLWKKEFGIK